MKSELLTKLSSIQTESDFCDFIGSLSEYEQSDPPDWKNVSLDSYLNAITKLIEKKDFNVSAEADWKAYGDIFIAATMYE